MATRAELVRAINANRTQATRIRASTLTLLERLWRSMPDYRDADIDRFVARALPIVNAGMRQTAAMSAANVANLVRLIEGERLPAPELATDVTALRGTPAEVVYRRPATTVYTALAEGRTFRQAVELGRQRLVSIAATDLQLAKTHTARAAMAATDSIVGYRRGLKGSENCALCVVASTQRYHKGDLMPIHPGCDCETEPIVGDVDPGQIIDAELLDQAHDRIAETFASHNLSARDIDGLTNPKTGESTLYRDVLIVHEHGEIGPVLGVRGHHFTGPNDI